ncbi:DUF3048 domain-containing protein [Candidatus Saccharibacteria bacterium]|nr:DUF3048 domain-containing protein [Candidatus Saccharibacteria bacterium]
MENATKTDSVDTVSEVKAEPQHDTSKNATKKSSKSWLILSIMGGVALLAGIAMFIVPFVLPEETLPDLSFPIIPSTRPAEGVYSNLTGLPVASEADKTAPTYCIQTPNGTDGARPQAGLTQAGVVFEAIAEAGITRFAAIYQQPSSAVIGPIRSLRIYYLQWDTPFDCTIVHAGGAYDAIQAVRAGGYKDLSENYVYMYRGSYGSRLWNNLFTTGAYLAQFSSDMGYTSSDVKGFTRMTPAESERARIDATVAEKLVITEATSKNTSDMSPRVTEMAMDFGGWATFNVRYNYDSSSNTYLRSYATGAAHEVYDCPGENLGEVNPEDRCTLRQLAPSVVAVMMVEEHLAEYDHYHEDIKAVGSGEAYVFQNGIAIHGRWEKPSVEAQIRFYDESGAEIALAPGQTFVEAVPTYGAVRY